MPEEVSALAGKTIEQSMLVNVSRLVTAYSTGKPDPTIPPQHIAFGTSGHRGSAFDNAFNKAIRHISWQSAMRSVIIEAEAALRARCSLESTPTRCQRPVWLARSRYLPAMSLTR